MDTLEEIADERRGQADLLSGLTEVGLPKFVLTVLAYPREFRPRQPCA